MGAEMNPIQHHPGEGRGPVAPSSRPQGIARRLSSRTWTPAFAGAEDKR